MNPVRGAKVVNPGTAGVVGTTRTSAPDGAVLNPTVLRESASSPSL